MDREPGWDRGRVGTFYGDAAAVASETKPKADNAGGKLNEISRQAA
jgi:hypothetical protein